MTTQRTHATETRPFDILGISEAEERAYRWLLAHPRATAPEVALALGLTAGKAQRLLDAIEIKGLVTRTPERPRRYVSASPDIAMEALILQRQNDLQRARGAVLQLQEQAKVLQPDQQKQRVELITSREAERQIVEHMSRTAQREVVALVRPPMLISRLNLPAEEDNYTQRQAQARGVRSRSIVDGEFLALPGAVARTRSNIQAGEEVRALPQLPFKMVLTDRRLALIPLDLEQASSPVLLIRSSALLEALYALFEILWERAAPISFTNAGRMETGAPPPRFPEETKDLISLLAAGLNDKSIAAELEMSMRTLTRRIFELMQSLEARTRFQAGWIAALHLHGLEQASQI